MQPVKIVSPTEPIVPVQPVQLSCDTVDNTKSLPKRNASQTENNNSSVKKRISNTSNTGNGSYAVRRPANQAQGKTKKASSSTQTSKERISSKDKRADRKPAVPTAESLGVKVQTAESLGVKVQVRQSHPDFKDSTIVTGGAGHGNSTHSLMIDENSYRGASASVHSTHSKSSKTEKVQKVRRSLSRSAENLNLSQDNINAQISNGTVSNLHQHGNGIVSLAAQAVQIAKNSPVDGDVQIQESGTCTVMTGKEKSDSTASGFLFYSSKGPHNTDGKLMFSSLANAPKWSMGLPSVSVKSLSYIPSSQSIGVSQSQSHSLTSLSLINPAAALVNANIMSNTHTLPTGTIKSCNSTKSVTTTTRNGTVIRTIVPTSSSIHSRKLGASESEQLRNLNNNSSSTAVLHLPRKLADVGSPPRSPSLPPASLSPVNSPRSKLDTLISEQCQSQGGPGSQPAQLKTTTVSFKHPPHRFQLVNPVPRMHLQLGPGPLSTNSLPMSQQHHLTTTSSSGATIETKEFDSKSSGNGNNKGKIESQYIQSPEVSLAARGISKDTDDIVKADEIEALMRGEIPGGNLTFHTPAESPMTFGSEGFRSTTSDKSNSLVAR